MLRIIQDIPNVNTYPLEYVFEHLKLEHKPNTLWLEFGVANGRTINYISKFTNDKVYGFDSFEGLPEKWRDGFDKGAFNMDGNLPEVNNNVELIKGWFNDTLPDFIKNQNKKVSFIHMDADLYSSTKCIFNNLKDYIDKDCIIIFDELVNYPGFDGDTGELKAFYEFITENEVDYEWIGMNGEPTGMSGYYHENVALIIHSINTEKSLNYTPRVAIIMGSDSDLECMKEAAIILDEFHISYELTIVSAHRTPDRLYSYAKSAELKGIQCIIAGAGGAAHLPGMVASLTSLPVIGVPVKSSSLSGNDSLLSIVQMPKGIPVATVAIHNAMNAGLLACRILGAQDTNIRNKMHNYMSKQEKDVINKAEELENIGYASYLEKMS